MTYDYIVLGAGITGLALLKTLRRKGYNNILGIEAEKEAGGLCRTFYVEGHVCDIGGHFFKPSIKMLKALFSELSRKRKCIRLIPGFLKSD